MHIHLDKKLDATWTRHSASFEMVQQTWEKDLIGSPSFKLSKTLQSTREALKKWNKNHFGLCRVKFKKIED
jgi:hypothetical protein